MKRILLGMAASIAFLLTVHSAPKASFYPVVIKLNDGSTPNVFSSSDLMRPNVPFLAARVDAVKGPFGIRWDSENGIRTLLAGFIPKYVSMNGTVLAGTYTSGSTLARAALCSESGELVDVTSRNNSDIRFLSADGRSVFCSFYDSTFRIGRWNEESGFLQVLETDLAAFAGEAYSADGNAAAFTIQEEGVRKLYFWTERNGLNQIGEGDPIWLSADGSTLLARDPALDTFFRWKAGTGVDFSASGYPVDAANNGDTVIFHTGTPTHSFVVRGSSVVDVGSLRSKSDGNTYATAISSDGGTIVGNSNDNSGRLRAFRYTDTTGIMALDNFGDDVNDAFLVSGNGKVVAGTHGSGDSTRACLWNVAYGAVDLTELCAAESGGWILNFPRALSTDGTVIMGLGTSPEGARVAWVAKVQFAATPVLNWSTPPDIIYGQALGSTELNASAFYNGAPVTGSYAYDPPAGSVLPAGTHTLKVTFTPDDSASYEPVTQSVTLMVRKAPLVIKAEDAYKPYFSSNPDLHFSYSGFVNGEGPEVLAAQPTISTTAMQNSPPGEYPITVAGASADNYDITYANGRLIIYYLGMLAGPVLNPANNHAYYLLDIAEWPAAEMAARLLGGHLVTINDAGENEFVYDHFSNFGGSPRWLWTGLHDTDPANNATDPVARRSEFAWISGEPVEYSNWPDSEPNNYLGAEFYGMLFSPELMAGGKWNDGGGWAYGVVEVLPTAVLAGPVINPANGHGYYLLDESDWERADAKARQMGGHLATIRNEQEQQFVFDTFANYGGVSRHLWIGLYDTDQANNASDPVARRSEFAWASGEPVGYMNWSDGEPNNSNSSGEFWGHMFAPSWIGAEGQTLTFYGEWNDSGKVTGFGGAPLNGVVEVPAAPVIYGPVLNPANGREYYLLDESNWEVSEMAAQALGGHLATIRNAEEQQFLFDTFSNYGGEARHLWIGLHDSDPTSNSNDSVSRKAEFVWASGEPVTYSNWNVGEPNNFMGEEFYTMMFAPTAPEGGGLWNDTILGNWWFFNYAPTHGVAEVIPYFEIQLSRTAFEYIEMSPATPIDPDANVLFSSNGSLEALSLYIYPSERISAGGITLLEMPGYTRTGSSVARDGLKIAELSLEGDTGLYLTFTPEATQEDVRNFVRHAAFSSAVPFPRGPLSISFQLQRAGSAFYAGPVSVNYKWINHNPTANPDSAATTLNKSFSFSANKLAANDTDPDGDTLSVAAVDGAGSKGTVTLANGTLTYTPPANYEGLDTFSYTVSDGNGGSATALVTVKINPPSFILPLSVTKLADGSALVKFSGKPRTSYLVQGSQDGASWTDIATAKSALNGAFSITDKTAAANPGRMYRAFIP